MLRPGGGMRSREAEPGVERMGVRRQQTRAKNEGAGRSNAPHVKPVEFRTLTLEPTRIDEVWLRIRAGAVGLRLHPCSAKPRSASHLLGCSRLVRPVASKLRRSALKPRAAGVPLSSAAPAMTAGACCVGAVPCVGRHSDETHLLWWLPFASLSHARSNVARGRSPDRAWRFRPVRLRFVCLVSAPLLGSQGSKGTSVPRLIACEKHGNFQQQKMTSHPRYGPFVVVVDKCLPDLGTQHATNDPTQRTCYDWSAPSHAVKGTADEDVVQLAKQEAEGPLVVEHVVYYRAHSASNSSLPKYRLYPRLLQKKG
jgi:hypothetical protein